MGDPKRQRKQYHPPSHPWQGVRIEAENKILRGYGLKNKKEIYKMSSILSNFTAQAKKIAGRPGVQSEKEKALLLKRIYSLGLIAQNAQLEDVLALTLGNIFDRRLQTFVYRKALAKSMKQARQFITHGHIIVGNKKIGSPSYLVRREEEEKISFSPKSAFISEGHAERAKAKSEGKKKARREAAGKKRRSREERRGMRK